MAREMAAAYERQVAFFRSKLGLTRAEADAEARLPAGGDAVLDQPIDRITWSELGRLTGMDPEKGWAAWERIKAEARAELASGARAARALED